MSMPDAPPPPDSARAPDDAAQQQNKPVKIEFIDLMGQGVIDPRAESKRYDVVKQFAESIAASSNVFASATIQRNDRDPAGATYTFGIELKLVKPIQVRQ